MPLPPPPLPRSRSLAVSAVLGLATLGALITTLVPTFGEVFRQVKVALPGSTIALLNLSEFLIAHGWVAVLLLIAVYDVLSRLPPDKAGVARILVPVVVVACLAWMVFALFHPLIGTLEGIGHRR